jgi:hypothetical protein
MSSKRAERGTPSSPQTTGVKSARGVLAGVGTYGSAIGVQDARSGDGSSPNQKGPPGEGGPFRRFAESEAYLVAGAAAEAAEEAAMAAVEAAIAASEAAVEAIAASEAAAVASEAAASAGFLWQAAVDSRATAAPANRTVRIVRVMVLFLVKVEGSGWKLRSAVQ